MDTQFSKRADDQFVGAVDFRRWPLGTTDHLVQSNPRGSLEILVEDESGADVTSSLTGPEGLWISGPGLDLVNFWIIGGIEGQRYKIVVGAPTYEGEFLTAVAYLSILP